MLPIRTILYPTDFSPHSDLACQFAGALARDYGARLIVAHVFHEPVVAYGAGLTASDRDAAEIELKSWASLLASQFGLVAVEHRLAVGNPAAEILRLAEEVKSDLIVLGTHGRTGLGRLVLGSVAERVLRGAACPVVTARASSALVAAMVPGRAGASVNGSWGREEGTQRQLTCTGDRS